MGSWIHDGFLDSRWVFRLKVPSSFLYGKLCPKRHRRLFGHSSPSEILTKAFTLKVPSNFPLDNCVPRIGAASWDTVRMKIVWIHHGSPTWLDYGKCSKLCWPSTLRIKCYSWSRNGTEVAAQSLMLCAVRVTVICKGKRIEGRAPARP